MRGEIEASRQLFSLDCSEDPMVCPNQLTGLRRPCTPRILLGGTLDSAPSLQFFFTRSAHESGNGNTLGEDLCQSDTDLALKLVVAKIKIRLDLQMIYSECPLLLSL